MRISLILLLILSILVLGFAVVNAFRPLQTTALETYIEAFRPNQTRITPEMQSLVPELTCTAASWYAHYCYGQNDQFRITYSLPGGVNAPSTSLIPLYPLALGELVAIWGRPNTFTHAAKKIRAYISYTASWDDVGGYRVSSIIRSYGPANAGSLVFSINIISLEYAAPR